MTETNTLQAIAFGEVLWDLLPSGPKAGGAPMNVAYHLQALGHRCFPVSRIGTDEWGVRLRAHLSALPLQFVEEDSLHPTGLVEATLNERGEATYHIRTGAAWDFIEGRGAEEAVASADHFIYGSLAARAPVSRAALLRLLERARHPVLDINLRAPHYSAPVLEELMRRAALLKLNEDELALLSGEKGVEAGLRRLEERFRIPALVVTLGGRGAALLEDGHYTEGEGYAVQVADTVGSGDAFLAGLLHARAAGRSPEGVLQFANALGALVASKEGATPQWTRGEVDQLTGSTDL